MRPRAANAKKIIGHVEASSSDRAFQPTPRQCAMLVLHLIKAKEKESEKEVTRARLSEATLRRLWNRSWLGSAFILEVDEWLSRAGWALFFARSTFAIIKVDVIEGWVRIASKRIAEDLNVVSRGRYDFNQLESLLVGDESGSQDDE